MILINLLPHREAARKRRRDAFYATLVLAALLGVAASVLVYGWFQTQISGQQARNLFLSTEVKRLELQIKDVAELQAEILALRARQQAVEDLQADRNLPVQLLNEVVKRVPDGVYLTTLKQANESITLLGVAQSNERVAELLRNLGNNSPWITKPELVEIAASSVTLGTRDQRRVSSFTIRVQLRRASEAQQATGAESAASAPAKI